MRILLDECLPSDLVKELKDHEVRTVTQAGWSGIGNGELLRLAARDYEVLLKIDQRLSREQRIPATLVVITLEAPTNRIDSLRPLIPALNKTLASVKPGQSMRVRRG
jgi:predicted nuclease of predicted toxin-antitoxin system